MAAMNCAKCEKEATDDDFCFGCGRVVCAGCGSAPMGKHRLEDHNPPCMSCGERVEDAGELLCNACTDADEEDGR